MECDCNVYSVDHFEDWSRLQESVNSSHSTAASHILTVVVLVSMYNSAGRSPCCQNREIPSDFHLHLRLEWAATPLLNLSSEKRTATLEALLLCGQFPLPGEKWAEECIEGQSSISKRKTKIMIALTCSWGAVCSLKSSREEVIQWRLLPYSAIMLEGEQHTQNKYENTFTLSETRTLASMLTLLHVVTCKETCIWDNCLCQFYSLIYCHLFSHF